ncbi:MAG: RnfABCDGE type electron transport complex subunit G [Clostridia bacterium]|nr:RnfABCDGE type electron transport complex subunit G [Clostridia bacterium]
MENNKQNSFTLIAKPALILMAICAIVTTLLAMTNMLTVGKIADNAAQKAAESRMKVLAAQDYRQLDSDGAVYGAYDENGNLIGVVITTLSSGYGGKIEVMTGIRNNGEISGVTILSMEETPGLGARGKEDSFLRQYKGHDHSSLAVSKDGGEINALSGATITSRAITKAVNEAVELSKSYLGTVSASDIPAATGGNE